MVTATVRKHTTAQFKTVIDYPRLTITPMKKTITRHRYANAKTLLFA